MQPKINLASHCGAVGLKEFKHYSGGDPLRRERDMQICLNTYR